MKLESEFLRGSYTPMVTPFSGGRVDYDAFARLLERQLQEGSHGLVVCGTTGEPNSLTPQERNELLAVAVQSVGGKMPVVAATGAQSFEDTLHLCVQAESIGADALLIVTPYYVKPPQQGLYQYFTKLAGEFSLPWMIYHIPGRTAVSLDMATVEQILNACPTLVGIKHAANDLEFISEALARFGKEFRIFCGLESLSLPMLTIGAAGLMNAVGNLVPATVARLCNQVDEGNLEEARRLHFELFELSQAIFLSANPIPLKYMMARLGLLQTDELRLPLYPLSETETAQLDSVLQRAGLLNGVNQNTRI